MGVRSCFLRRCASKRGHACKKQDLTPPCYAGIERSAACRTRQACHKCRRSWAAMTCSPVARLNRTPRMNGFGKADAREIDVGVRPEKLPHVILSCKERRDGVAERRSRPRPDGARSFRLEACFHRWFEKLHEPSADETGLCRTTPPAAIALRASGGRLHRREVDAVAGAQVVETFRDAPRPGLRAPGASCFRQAGNERARVAFRRVQCLFQSSAGRPAVLCPSDSVVNLHVDHPVEDVLRNPLNAR